MEKSKLIDKYILGNRSWVVTYNRSYGDEPGDSLIIVRHKPGSENFQLFHTEEDSGEKDAPYENTYFVNRPRNSSLLDIVKNLSPLLLPSEVKLITTYRKLGACINGGLEDEIRKLVVDIGL